MPTCAGVVELPVEDVKMPASAIQKGTSGSPLRAAVFRNSPAAISFKQIASASSRRPTALIEQDQIEAGHLRGIGGAVARFRVPRSGNRPRLRLIDRSNAVRRNAPN